MLAEAEIRRLKLVRLESGSAPPTKNFDSTSYNLCLGAQYYLFAGKEPTPLLQDCSTGTGVLRIPPFACVLVGTDELLYLPNNVYARWGLKIRPAMSGLIFQAGPQIEPESCGRMFGLLFNLSNSEKTLSYREPLWSVDFATLDGTSSRGVRPLNNSNPTLNLSAYTSRGIPGGSLNAIHADYLELTRQNSAKREYTFGIILIVATVLASIILPLVVSSTVGAEGQISRLEQRVQQLESQASATPSTPAPSPTASKTP